jgi:hypothetical protein
MYKNVLRAAFTSSLLSFILFACQKDIKDTSMSAQQHHDAKFSQPGEPTLLVSGLEVSFGSTTGPEGDLFVPDAISGEIYRIDTKSGDRSLFASGLPQMIPEIGIGGIMDVAFIGKTAYALVTLVDDPIGFPTGQVNGIYRIDGPDSYTIIADIGAYNFAHQPTEFPIDVFTGVLYSFEPYRGGFIVTDGHFNRIFNVTLDGNVVPVRQFGNIVPTGLAIKGNQIFFSQAGPVPHNPADGKIASFISNSSGTTNIASGAPLLVDVEFGRGQTMFALSQGDFSGDPAGSPALPNTGSLVRVNSDGTLSIVADELDRPTSLEIIANIAYIITITGEVWTVDNIANPPFGSH